MVVTVDNDKTRNNHARAVTEILPRVGKLFQALRASIDSERSDRKQLQGALGRGLSSSWLCSRL